MAWLRGLKSVCFFSSHTPSDAHVSHELSACLASLLRRAEDRESLKFKLSGARDYDALAAVGAEPKNVSEDNLGGWGHEFVRSLAGEIGQEYNQRVIDGADPDDNEPFEDLLKFVRVIVPFHLTHNAEAEAVDLLIEVQRLKYLLEIDSIDENNYKRICLYLVKTASFMPDPEDLVVSLCRTLDCSYELFLQVVYTFPRRIELDGSLFSSLLLLLGNVRDGL